MGVGEVVREGLLHVNKSPISQLHHSQSGERLTYGTDNNGGFTIHIANSRAINNALRCNHHCGPG